jgi:hypothetical protein
MHQKVFIERYNSFFGESIDSLEQITNHTMFGEELIEFMQSLSDLITFPNLNDISNHTFNGNGIDLYNFIINNKE